MSIAEFYNPGTTQWISCSDGFYPPNAVVVGIEDELKIFVARAHFEGAIIPGLLHECHHFCYFGWKGKEHAVASYEVLIAVEGTLEWEPSNCGNIVRHAVVGGRTDTGEPLYIGRLMYNRILTPGRIQPSHSACYILHDGKEMAFRKYEVLRG